eukprot:3143312-Rhodomonas_salina.1
MSIIGARFTRSPIVRAGYLSSQIRACQLGQSAWVARGGMRGAERWREVNSQVEEKVEAEQDREHTNVDLLQHDTVRGLERVGLLRAARTMRASEGGAFANTADVRSHTQHTLTATRPDKTTSMQRHDTMAHDRRKGCVPWSAGRILARAQASP